MEGNKLKDLKLKEIDSIQEMFDRAFKRVNTFEDFGTELVKGKEKRARTELIQEIIKKQKVEDDKEIAKLKQLMKIIPDEDEVAIDTIPLAVKSSSIVGWKIYKEGRKSYYQIMRADGKSQITGSLYPKTYWELLPKEILGATTQRVTGSYYPKRYWELLPKEILEATTQRETGMSYGKMEVT
ncbi:hypothetical protein Tco_0111798 [Tanacetum coccineum]